MNYLFCEIVPGSKVCRLGALQNVDNDYELKNGISRKATWPKDACYYMDKKRKDYIRLDDFLWSIGTLLVVSGKVRHLIGEDLKYNEFLPLTIYNHKDRPIKEEYFILNQTELQDCMDLKESKFERNAINPNYISTVEKLVVDERNIKPDVDLCRMKYFPTSAIVSRRLAEKIKGAGLTGIIFGEIEKYPNLDFGDE